jgi:Tfp pilus assembly protein PilZ
MFIRSRRALPLGTEVLLTLSLPGEPESIQAVGEVLRQTTSGADSIQGLAIRFVEVEGDGRARLAKFVAQHEHTFLGTASD